MPGLFTFPDVELWATGYLRAGLLAAAWPVGLYVGNRPAAPRQDRMVVVRRDGGRTEQHRDLPRLSVRVWGTDDDDAAKLSADVGALLRRAAGNGGVRRAVHLSGPSLTTDEVGKPMRYMLFEFVTRGSTT